MKKYEVTYYHHTFVSVVVEAEDEEEALENANQEVCDKKYERPILDNLQEDNDPDIIEVED